MDLVVNQGNQHKSHVQLTSASTISWVLSLVDKGQIDEYDQHTMVVKPGGAVVIDSHVTKFVVVDYILTSCCCVVALGDEAKHYLVMNLESEQTMLDINIHDIFPRELTMEERPRFEQEVKNAVARVKDEIKKQITQALQPVLQVSDAELSTLKAIEDHHQAQAFRQVVLVNPNANRDNFFAALLQSPLIKYSEYWVKEIPTQKVPYFQAANDYKRVVFETEKQQLSICDKAGSVLQTVSIER